jgi:methanogenic corrinoid protein MtbC1
MNAEARQASLVIDSVAKAVANWTVDRHAELNPKLPNRYGPGWRADWIGHTLSQIHMLAQAVSVRSADLFAQTMLWTRESFKLRGMEGDDLACNTKCMREVLAKELPLSVNQIAIDFVDASIEALSKPGGDFGGNADPDSAHRKTVLEYLEAVLAGDRCRAESLILEAHTDGASVTDIYENILTPAQARLGRMWHRGEITVADEHFGSATTQAIMGQLRSHFQRAKPNGRTMVATSTPGDLHEIGLRMVADLFEINGWNVIYLGANTPIIDVIELLERRHSELLALSVSTALTLRDAGELIDAVRGSEAIERTKVLIGGPPFKAVQELWRELGADGCALSATEAINLGNQLVEQ